MNIAFGYGSPTQRRKPTMRKLTTPKAILIGSLMIASAVLFRVDGAIIEEANAEVAGMNHKDLRKDKDFKKAVIYLVEKCEIKHSNIKC
jgi:hypothetical protein